MPQKFPWSKSNRSQPSVDTLPPRHSSLAAPSAKAAIAPDLAQEHAEVAAAAAAAAEGGRNGGRGGVPVAYNRHSTPILAAYPSRDLHPSPGPSPSDDSLDAPEPKKPSLTSRIAAGVRGHKKDDAAKHVHRNGVARSKSVRTSDSRAQDQPSSQQQQPSPQWSNPHLPELDDDELDPFLQQTDRTTFTAHPRPLQDQYTRPPLDRVSTEGSFHTQGGVDHPQQTKQQHQPPPPQQQYQSYHPPLQHPHTVQEYHAFHPQSSPSPQPQPAQLHGQGAPGHDPAQQPALDHHQHPHQLPHQGQRRGSSDTPQHYQRPPSQQQQEQAEPPQSQATRRAPQTLHQTRQIDAQPPHQLRPPSSHQQLPAPSPVQPYFHQNHDAQSQSSYSLDPHAHNITPPQDSMASQGPSGGRNTLRKMNDSGQPGPPTRESSLLQQPPAQGQHLGPPPVSPGLATFDANVVPTASQGQPYRGDKQGQQGQGEMGRATPPPRLSTTDVTDEDIEKMIKDHDVLREKYQKVKRYFFEQQTQVHQLQNTLANQRLSVSRTSWDDSEYSTRFNRLDGLIAQLSFTIRKDWRLIPQWLQVAVNKTAVETGKQEMTAVGRAFVSHWLVENIFNKYFHPDLEPGFSTQLQSIVSNIRKFSPPCHSIEDEESLAAKIINWRLATVEGLADTLRGPQAETYRKQLTETLNEKLIASLQMHLNDPAPPDLAGGVPMIIELAISIAQHLPLESREVQIEYFLPGHAIVPESMKIETTIPALTAPIMEPDEADRASMRSVASRVEEGVSIAEQDQLAQPKEDKKRGMFSFGGSKKPLAAPASLSKRESSLGLEGSQQSLAQNAPGSSGGPKDEPAASRVRMAAGLAVQIRGKSILVKAAVYGS